MRKVFNSVIALGVLSVASLHGQLVNYSGILGGTTASYTWEDFQLPDGVSPGVSGTAGEWAGTTTATNNGIAANDGAALGNLFYVPLTATGTALHASDVTDFVGGGIYGFFSQTHLQIQSSNIAFDVNTIVLQLNTVPGTATPMGGGNQDFVTAPSLTLYYSDDTSEQFGYDFTLLQSSQPYNAPVLGMTTLNTYGFQWDLSGVSKTVVGYTVDFQMAYHGMIFGANTTESSEIFTQTALVPEPSTWALLGLGTLFVILYARKRNKASAAI